MINVACVLNVQHNRRGPQYSIKWVDRLYRAIARNLDIPFRFTCLSNVNTPYTTIKLVSNSDMYWNKIELFRKDIFQGPVLYLDLDVIICKNITNDIKKLPIDKFLMVEEPYKKIHNSSIMSWNGDYSYLYEDYIQNQHSIVKEYADISRQGNLGDQGYINENVKHDLIHNYTNDNFVGWQHHKINSIISNPSVLIFTGTQKPSNNTDLDIVKENWI